MTADPTHWRYTRHPCGCVSRFDLDRMRSQWTRRCAGHQAEQDRKAKGER